MSKRAATAPKPEMNCMPSGQSLVARSTTPLAPDSLERQVQEHPVVQEILRVFRARVDRIEVTTSPQAK